MFALTWCLLSAIEPVRAEKERIDEIKQAEARKAAEAEQARIDGIKSNIAKIASLEPRSGGPFRSAADYQQHITWLKELAITDEVFGEFIEEANTARDAALFKLTQWHKDALEREEADRKRAEQQAALDKQREEQEATAKRQREAEEALEKKASEAGERKAAEEKAAQEKAEREQREKDATEHRRLSKIQAAIEIKRTIPDRAHGLTSEALDRLIVTELESKPTADDFEELLPDAIEAWDKSIKTLSTILAETRASEEKFRRDEEARLPDKDKLLRWCDAIASIPEPAVLNDKAQRVLQRYASDLLKLCDRLRSDIEKL